MANEAKSLDGNYFPVKKRDSSSPLSELIELLVVNLVTPILIAVMYIVARNFSVKNKSLNGIVEAAGGGEFGDGDLSSSIIGVISCFTAIAFAIAAFSWVKQARPDVRGDWREWLRRVQNDAHREAMSIGFVRVLGISCGCLIISNGFYIAKDGVDDGEAVIMAALLVMYGMIVVLPAVIKSSENMELATYASLFRRLVALEGIAAQCEPNSSSSSSAEAAPSVQSIAGSSSMEVLVNVKINGSEPVAQAFVKSVERNLDPVQVSKQQSSLSFWQKLKTPQSRKQDTPFNKGKRVWDRLGVGTGGSRVATLLTSLLFVAFPVGMLIYGGAGIARIGVMFAAGAVFVVPSSWIFREFVYDEGVGLIDGWYVSRFKFGMNVTVLALLIYGPILWWVQLELILMSVPDPGLRNSDLFMWVWLAVSISVTFLLLALPIWGVRTSRPLVFKEHYEAVLSSARKSHAKKFDLYSRREVGERGDRKAVVNLILDEFAQEQESASGDHIEGDVMGGGDQIASVAERRKKRVKDLRELVNRAITSPLPD